GGAGGALAPALERLTLDAQTPEPTRRVWIGQSQSAFAAPNPAVVEAFLPVGRLAASGIDKLRVRSDDEIAFAGAVDLALGRSLRLDAPVIRGAAATSAQPSAP